MYLKRVGLIYGSASWKLLVKNIQRIAGKLSVKFLLIRFNQIRKEVIYIEKIYLLYACIS